MASYLRPRRGKKATAVSQNVVLRRGEIFFEVPDTGVGTGNGKIKMGDGTTAYSALPYFMEPTQIDVAASTIEFTEATETDNSVLLSAIASGAQLKTLIGNIKKLLSNLNTSVTQLNNDLGTLSFGKDSDGNWGYIVGGADTVTPFKKASDFMVGTAAAAQVLSGYTFTNASSVGISGTMDNKGAVSSTLNCGGSYTIPKGYHNGSGKVTANTLASQTSATATAAEISKGKTAWVNGTKITGTMTQSLGSVAVVAKRYTDSSAAFTVSGLTSGKKYLLVADGCNARGPGTTDPTLSSISGFRYTEITTVVPYYMVGYALYLITTTSTSISVSGNGHHLYWTLISL